MVASPKKSGAATATNATLLKKKRSTVALAATAVLIASVCGAIAGAFLFYNMGSETTTAASSVAASTGRQHIPVAASAAKTESATLKQSVGSACKIQHCKAGGSEVCGTDGKTYLNECFFQNAHCKSPSIGKVNDWKGYNCPHSCKKQIACKEVGVFLCASDGNVYFGYCNLYIAQCLDPSIQEVECDKSIFEGVFNK